MKCTDCGTDLTVENATYRGTDDELKEPRCAKCFDKLIAGELSGSAKPPRKPRSDKGKARAVKVGGPFWVMRKVEDMESLAIAEGVRLGCLWLFAASGKTAKEAITLAESSEAPGQYQPVRLHGPVLKGQQGGFRLR